MRVWLLRALVVGALGLTCSCVGMEGRAGSLPGAVPQVAPSGRQAAPSVMPAPDAVQIDGQRLEVPARPRAEIFRGTGSFVAQPHRRDRSTGVVEAEDGITLNFLNADVKDVAKAVLGDFLKLNYAVGTNVQGIVTIETSRPLARASVLPVFEQALRLNNMALVKSEGLYKVVALADAPRESGAARVSTRRGGEEAGFGLEIVSLQYVSASEMERLLTPLAPSQGLLHSDPVRNVLIIQGTEQERRMMLDNIALFDVDYLSGMSFALFTPNFTDAPGLAKELNEIIGGKASPLDGVVRIVPIERLNAVLAISPQARYLERLKRWVERLDKPGQNDDRRIFVYHVQNGRATDLAAVLVKVLGGGNAAAVPGQKAAFFSGAAALAPGQSLEGVQAPPGGLISPLPSQNMSDADGGVTATGVSVEGLGTLNITADETNNALVILASPREYGVIETALRQLDIVPLQVLIEAAIAEVTLTDDLKYGVQYFYQPNNRHQVVLSDSKASTITATYPAFSYVFSDGNNIKVILDALSAVTHVDVVSSPQLLVLNNQTASLQVGDQVPIATEQAVSVASPGAPLVNSIQYHDTGVILKVTPRVNQGGMVMMDITQEVSDVTATDTSTIDSPTIQQRKISSTVAVRDNETIALGGLMKDNRTRGRSGIPFLQDIPVMGNLFRTTQDNRTKTELMVLITPHVVDNFDRARAVTDELRAKLPAVQSLLDGRK